MTRSSGPPSPNQTAAAANQTGDDCVKSGIMGHKNQKGLNPRLERILPHNLGPIPENLHANVAGPISLRRDIDLAEFGLFEG